MKIFINLYLDSNNIGNYKTIYIEIPSNKIYVKELKKIISEKLNIKENEQRLTFKLLNTYITLTNEFQLRFFYIKSNSTIYLELIKEIDKNEEIKKKILQNKNTKLKYLSMLGFYDSNSYKNKRSTIFVPSENNLNLSPVKESLIEGLDEINLNSIDSIIEIIKKNNFNEFYEFIEQYSIKSINIYNSNKWAPLHFACYNGNAEITAYILYNLNGDINILNKDGWTALHLAVYKQNEDCVRVLIANENINTNIKIQNGLTALHFACKKNNLKIISILVYKADVNIRDDSGKLPFDYTTDNNIKKFLIKISESKNEKKVKKIKSNTSSLSHKSKDNENENNQFSFLKNIQNIPKNPPKVYGLIEKTGKYIKIYRSRYIELDPYKGFLRRFKSYEDFPNNPNEVIPLKLITKCIICPYNQNDKEFYFEIDYNYIEKYKVRSLSACEKWVEMIHLSLNFRKFWDKLKIEYNNIDQYLYNISPERIDINGNTGKIIEYDSKGNIKNKKQKQKINMLDNNILNDDGTTLLEDSYKMKKIGTSSFDIIELIGRGTFGKVYKVKSLIDKKVYAMKVLDKNFLISNNQLKYAISECNILKQASYPFIIKLHYSFQTKENLYMILDYCPGGDLGFHLQLNLFEEEEAKFYISELILAIEYLHNMNVIYRDLKPENILIGSDNHIKLADFGLAKENIKDNTLTNSFCGSPAYLSPEMVNKKGASKASDIYGIGAVLFELISGTPPFYANDINTLYQNIIGNKLIFHDYFSDELKDLLSKLLEKDPNKRLGVNDKKFIKEHEFFYDVNWEELEKKNIKPPVDLVYNKLENEIPINNNKGDLDKGKNKNNNDNNINVNHGLDDNKVKNFTFVRPNSPNDNKN